MAFSVDKSSFIFFLSVTRNFLLNKRTNTAKEPYTALYQIQCVFLAKNMKTEQKTNEG